MINKLFNIWFIGLVILLTFTLTVMPIVTSIIMTIIFNDALWILFNLAYIILFPVICVMWKFICDIIPDGGII